MATSTFRCYDTALQSYQNFCIGSSVSIFPLQEHTLQRYAAYMARLVSYKTIKTYLAGLQYHSHVSGWPTSIKSMIRLYYLLRGIRRVQGSSFDRVRRRPITTVHLRLIRYRLRFLVYSDFERLALTSAATVAFFGLLRCSEYTCASSSSFDPLVDLLASNVTIAENLTIMSVRLKSSKTDPFRDGCTIRIGATGNDLCPVRLMHRYLSVHPFRQGPLFVLSATRFITRVDMVNLLTRCLPGLSNINTHSFRIGGASAAASAGIPDSTIQILGRWSSDAYRRYIRVSNGSVISLSQRIGSVNSLSRVWSLDLLSSSQP